MKQKQSRRARIAEQYRIRSRRYRQSHPLYCSILGKDGAWKPVEIIKHPTSFKDQYAEIAAMGEQMSASAIRQKNYEAAWRFNHFFGTPETVAN